VFLWCLAPRIPSSIQIESLTANSLTISWTAAEGASYYEIAIEDDEGQVGSYTRSDTTIVSVSELQPGTTYRLSVTVYDSDERRGNTLQTVVSTGNYLPVNLDYTPCPDKKGTSILFHVTLPNISRFNLFIRHISEFAT